MFLNQTIPPPFLKGWSVIFFGGDVNFEKQKKIPIMAESNFRIVNFEYNRAHSEQINLLAAAKIDVAITSDKQANNYLDRAGILNLTEDNPLFVESNKIVVALFNAAPDKPDLWKDKIADAQKKADVVLVALNCDIEQLKILGKVLIDSGADGVLSCNSQIVQGVETYKERPIICGAGSFGFSLVISKRGVEEIYFMPLTEQAKETCAEFSDSCRKLKSKVISLASDLLKLKFEPPRAERKLEPVEISRSRRGEKILPITKPQQIIDSAVTPKIKNPAEDENIVEEFKREFKNKNGVMFFMLRGIKPKASGLEQSAFRRAKLFREHFGIEINFVTHEYQNDILEQRDAYGLNVRVLNMYDYFQEINRDIEKPRKVFIGPMQDGWQIERPDNRDLRVYRQNGKLAMYCVFALKEQKLSYINFFNEAGKKFRRDIYDTLGFLSCRQELENERPKEISYYRPDGTLAIREIYQIVKGKNTFATMELVNRAGNITKTFSNRDNALSYFLLQNLNDATKNYFLIGDRTPEWHEAYADIKSAGLNNVRVIHQLHNVHVRAPYDPLTSELKPRNKYFLDDKFKADAIITLTTKQNFDIVKRYNLNNVVTLPHSLTAVPKVTDVKLNPFKIVQVGRIVEEKGHAKAVEVMKRVIEKVPQATLHFYGSGSLQSKVQELIDANNLGAQIKFEGFSENMPAVFASSALSILPSTFEGSPLVIQESLQQDCPVVAFDCNYGPSDSIVNGVNGYLVPVGDVDAMADRIIKILTEPGLRDKLAANCAKSIEKFYPEVVARQWAKLFCNFMRQ